MKYSKTIWLLSLVSLFTDMASEMLYPIMPIYLKHIGFTLIGIGLLEGFAEAVAGLSKSYFGGLSDRSGKRLPFVQWGYFLSAISKPLMGLFTFTPWVFVSRTIDRIGKGIRTGARDAMLNAAAPTGQNAAVFGFHRAFDTFGAVIGPAFALLYLYFYPENYKWLFFLAFIPGIAAVAFTRFLPLQPEIPGKPKSVNLFESFSYWKNAGNNYKVLCRILLLFALINSSDLLLLLKIKESGQSDTIVIGIYIFYNLIYALASWPAGWLADKLGMRNLMVIGVLMFSIVYIGFAFNHSIVGFLILFIIYGLYAACNEGISKAWISSLVPKNETATAIGTLSGFQSIATLLASSIAGFLWFNFGAIIAFGMSGAVAIIVALLLLLLKGDKKMY
jgi:MFS family permease